MRAWRRLAHCSLESCTTWRQVYGLAACSPAKGLPFVADVKRGRNDPTSQPSWEVQEEHSCNFRCWKRTETCRKPLTKLQPAVIQMVTPVIFAFNIFSRKWQRIEGCQCSSFLIITSCGSAFIKNDHPRWNLQDIDRDDFPCWIVGIGRCSHVTLLTFSNQILFNEKFTLSVHSFLSYMFQSSREYYHHGFLVLTQAVPLNGPKCDVQKHIRF